MLGSRVLPSGMGHTTNCFVQVQGTDKPKPFLLRPGSDEQEAVSSLALAHALSDEKLHTDSLIQLFWPKDQCSLLREGVVRLRLIPSSLELPTTSVHGLQPFLLLSGPSGQPGRGRGPGS